MAPAARTALTPREISDHVAASRAGQPAQLARLLFWMSGTLFSFIIAALGVRALAKNLSVFEMMSGTLLKSAFFPNIAAKGWRAP